MLTNKQKKNTIKHNNILVTGGAGYVGAVLVPKLLEKGYTVKVLDWFLYGDVFKNHESRIMNQGPQGRYNKNLICIKGDLRNKKTVEKALEGIDAVIHLACISNDPSFELDPKLGKSVNYDAGIQLYDLAQKKKIKRFIYASSSSVYGVKNEKNVTEDLPLEPLTDYSKYKAMCEDYFLEHKDNNMTLLIFRPATVCGYSPRMRLDLTVNMLTVQALVNKKMTVFGGKQLRPNIHIQDMTDLYIQSLENPDESVNGKKFNAGYENYSVLAIAKMIKEIVQKDVEIIVTPSNDNRSYHISSEKIKKELGFVPKHTVEEAIMDIKKAYENELLPSPLTDKRYYNIKTMMEAGIK